MDDFKINGYGLREFTVIELITEFQSKAGCHWTQDKAFNCWKKLLETKILDIKYDNGLPFSHWIGVAWRHVNDEGREELDYWCNKLKELVNKTY